MDDFEYRKDKAFKLMIANAKATVENLYPGDQFSDLKDRAFKLMIEGARETVENLDAEDELYFIPKTRDLL